MIVRINIKSKISCALFAVFSASVFAQNVEQSQSLNQNGALELAKAANMEAKKIEKNISVAILNSSGVTLLLLKGNNVGPHNTEASRRKAYTAFSTKTASWELMHKAQENKDSQNLNTLPELLLLGGGVPVWKDGELIGSIGVSGGGGSENDHNIAVKAIENSGFKASKK